MNPEKAATFIFLVVLTVVPLKAQWDIGGVIDFNVAGISVNPPIASENFSSRFVPGIGAVANRQITDRIELHAEPMFLQKGARLHDGSEIVVFRINYLEIPLMITYSFRMDGPLVPYAMIGPSIGMLAGASYKFSDGWVQDEKDHTGFFDLGAGFGGGVKLPMGNNFLFGEARYMLGFVNVNTEVDESAVRNRGLQMLVGLTLPVGAR
jgi:hypothetical protein